MIKKFDKFLFETLNRKLTLYHGTCKENANNLVENGWKPSNRIGSNLGQGKYLYLSSEWEDALWFAQEKGCNTVVEVKDVPIEFLRPDPEDEAGFSINDLLKRIDETGFPAKFALHQELDSKYFRIYK